MDITTFYYLPHGERLNTKPIKSDIKFTKKVILLYSTGKKFISYFDTSLAADAYVAKLYTYQQFYRSGRYDTSFIEFTIESI